MNKVITINLNGRAYQLEEAGFEALQKYLDQAARKLAENPDRDEVMADFEQAIADKCDKYLNSHKTVISVKEVEEVIKQMGPVHTAEETETKASDKKDDGAKNTGAAKKLFQIREGAMLSGVCNGLAAYFNMDVALVRIIFVGLTILTHGAWILVYIVMAVVIPFANTSEEQAEAHGMPFNAQELLDNARKKYAHLDKKYFRSQRKYWQKWAKEQRRQWTEKSPEQFGQFNEAGESFLKVMKGLAVGFLTLFWVWAITSLLTTGALFGAAFGAIPLWVMILIVTCLFNILILPLRIIRAPRSPYEYGRYGTLDGVLWLMIMVIAGWAVWTYVPETHVIWEHFMESLRQLFNK